MQEPGANEKRYNIEYVEGVNALSSFNVAKKTELRHAENARSTQIGCIEKRAGQTALGYSSGTTPFVATGNYGLFYFDPNTPLTNQGLYRISKVSPDSTASIYYLATTTDIWTKLSGEGTSITVGQFDYTPAEGCMFLVNHEDENRYISTNGTTVYDSTSAAGHLYNSPKAHRCNFYKGRLYLANYTYGSYDYKTSVIRSSYPMGLVSLVNADYSATATDINPATDFKVTDTKYIYAVSGADSYDIYRGGTLITTVTVSAVNETYVTVSSGTITGLKASDEIWIAGTYSGTKIFRWPKNPTIAGKDVKQYDTFKLAGGDNDGITMLTNIGNVLMVANKSSLSSWNDYTLENFDLGIGNVSENGYVKLLGSLYFMHYTGVYATSGGIPKLISNKVERYITGATKAGLEACAAGKKGRSIFFSIGDGNANEGVTLYNPDGSIEKVLYGVCLEYNLTQENWFIHTNVKASEFATFISSTDTDKLMMTDTGTDLKVKEFLSGTTDDGTEIPFRIDFNRMTLNPLFERINNPVALLLDTERGSNMKVFVSIVEGNPEWYEVDGDITKGLSVVKITEKDGDGTRGLPPACRLLDVSIRDSSNQICRLNRASLVFLPSNQDAIEN